MHNETPALQFDHLGVVVQDIVSGREFLQNALGVTHWTETTEDPGLGVSVQFGSARFEGIPSGPAYELISPLGAGSPIETALRAGKNILNHLAYLTPDMAASGAQLRAQGCCSTGEPRPAMAYGGRHVQFFVSPLRFIIELIESPAIPTDLLSLAHSQILTPSLKPRRELIRVQPPRRTRHPSSLKPSR